MATGFGTRISRLFSTTFSKIKEVPLLLKDTKQRWWVIVPSILVVGIAGGLIYYRAVYLPAHQPTGQTLQTTSARRGDILLSAGGTGTLQAANQVDLSFGSSGKLTKLDVKVGDEVKQGDLLAELDNNSQKTQYEKAQRDLANLTSQAAIAQGQADVATATTTLTDAKNHLMYVISPAVFELEQQVAADQKALDQAKAAAGSNPTADQQKIIDAAEAQLKTDEDKLNGNRIWYKERYVPVNFTVVERDPVTRQSSKVVEAPSDIEIATAEADYVVAQSSLQEAQWYLDALTGKDIPRDASGDNLATFREALQTAESAKAALDGTQIYAPFSGTVMSVGAQVGDTVGSTTVITLADLSKLYLQTYVDESDYEMFKVGNQASIVFDALPDQTFTGKVTQVDPSLNTSSGSSVVSGLVEMDSASADLLLGMAPSVDVIAGQAQNAVLVPITALHEYAPGKYAVFVMQNGKLTVDYGEVGLEDSVNAEIKSGLNPGEVVLTGALNTN